jgi:hypothetical protein
MQRKDFSQQFAAQVEYTIVQFQMAGSVMSQVFTSVVVRGG